MAPLMPFTVTLRHRLCDRRAWVAPVATTVAVASAALLGVPAAGAESTAVVSTSATAVAGQSWSRSAAGVTPLPTDAGLGGAYYAVPAPVDGEYAVTLTLASERVGTVHLTVEGTVLAVADVLGHKRVQHVATVTDGRLDVSLDSGTDGVSLVGFHVVPPGSGAAGSNWRRVYRNDFTGLGDVLAFQSSVEVNSRLTPGDTANSPLQKPSLRGNVQVVPDAGAQDGQALGVFTRIGEYATANGAARGWTNGRMMIKNQEHAPPVRVRARLRMTPSAYTKSAVMWWPAGGGWPWEVDFAETFGGTSTTDGWGSRQKISQRWHADLDGDGRAKEQLVKDVPLDATRFHVYDLFVTPERMWIEIDGVLRMETTDRRYIPTGPGFFSIGKAMTGRRDVAGRTEDAVIVDWVEIYRGGAV